MLMNKTVPMRWKAFRLPKRGNKMEEYEDAFAANPEAGRFAVADGASESSFAGLWARLLVEGFVKPASKPDPNSNWLEPQQKTWAKEVDNKSLAWYGEDKRAQGAYATFCGLVLRHTGKRPDEEWRALAVGDSCLFQVRQETLLKAFPLTKSDQFNNHPNLLNSRTDAAAQIRAHHQKERGTWRAGDHFYLMTDALAQWFLHGIEAGHRPWHHFDKIVNASNPEAAFADFIEEIRKRGVRNDDVTLIPILL
jgi:serine/threonine protein phosphatase PrpC